MKTTGQRLSILEYTIATLRANYSLNRETKGLRDISTSKMGSIKVKRMIDWSSFWIVRPGSISVTRRTLGSFQAKMLDRRFKLISG